MPTDDTNPSVVLQRFGCIHKALHGNGNHVLGRIVKTCEEMLHDRGCLTVTRSANPMESIMQGTEPIVQGRGSEFNDVDVYIHCEEKVGVKFARQVLEQSEKEGLKTIIVSVEGVTPFTKKECEDKKVQFMLAKDLYMNVTHHQLVPKHEVVTSCVYEKKCLPKILDSDKVVQYYDWPTGTVVQVKRCFGGHEPVPYFRVVCSAN